MSLFNYAFFSRERIRLSEEGVFVADKYEVLERVVDFLFSAVCEKASQDGSISIATKPGTLNEKGEFSSLEVSYRGEPLTPNIVSDIDGLFNRCLGKLNLSVGEYSGSVRLNVNFVPTNLSPHINID